MDTQNSQMPSRALHGNTDVPNDFQAGDFAQPPLVSPAATLGAATIEAQSMRQYITCEYNLGLFDGTDQKISFTSDHSTSDLPIHQLMTECKAKAKHYADSLGVSYLISFLGFYHSLEAAVA